MRKFLSKCCMASVELTCDDSVPCHCTVHDTTECEFKVCSQCGESCELVEADN